MRSRAARPLRLSVGPGDGNGLGVGLRPRGRWPVDALLVGEATEVDGGGAHGGKHDEADRQRGEVEGEDATRDLDLALDDDGNYDGTFAIDEVAADLLIVDERLFVRGEERFWTETALAADSQMAGSFAGQWVGLPAQLGNEVGGTCSLESFMAGLPSGPGVTAGGLPAEPEPGDDLGGICDLQSFLAEFTEADWDVVSKGETTEIDGTPALELIAEDDRGTTRMWVSTGQDNHVLKLTREGAEPDEFTLGDYNEPVNVSVRTRTRSWTSLPQGADSVNTGGAHYSTAPIARILPRRSPGRPAGRARSAPDESDSTPIARRQAQPHCAGGGCVIRPDRSPHRTAAPPAGLDRSRSSCTSLGKLGAWTSMRLLQ